MKLLKVDQNIYKTELWNSLHLDGHYDIFFRDISIEQFVLVKIGGFGGLTWFPKEEIPEVLINFDASTEVYVKSYIERVLSYCYPDKIMLSCFHPSMTDIMAVESLGGTLDTSNGFFRYNVHWAYDLLDDGIKCYGLVE